MSIVDGFWFWMTGGLVGMSFMGLCLASVIWWQHVANNKWESRRK